MEKTAELLIDENNSKIIYEIETPCLICGEGVPVFNYGCLPKVCEKCKAAVMKVREQDG